MRILELFQSLQGEGIWAGTPMSFIRLAGCNAAAEGLACVRWCDTSESWAPEAGQEVAVEQVAAAAVLPRVCVTGGEPLLQAEELAELVGLLKTAGRRVHLETNGTLPLPAGTAFDWVTVSPKPPRYAVTDALLGRVDEVKLIVDDDFSVAAAEALHERLPEAVFCLQPEASGGGESVRRATQLVMEHPAWRLSLQLHKLLGLP